MDDKGAFESRIAHVIQDVIGAPRPVDAMAVTRSAATRSPEWRLQSTFSLAKFVVAGVVLALVGGFALTTLSPRQQDVVAPGATPEDPRSPGKVSGSISELGRCNLVPTSGPFSRWSGGGAFGGYLYEGAVCRPQSEWSDPRLEGTLRIAEAMVRRLDGDLAIWKFAVSIENEEGGWLMQPIRRVEFAGSTPSDIVTWVLEGQGAYEGQVAVLQVEGHMPHDLLTGDTLTTLFDFRGELSSESFRAGWPGYRPHGFIVARTESVNEALAPLTESPPPG
jgi:hypothetical protein